MSAENSAKKILKDYYVNCRKLKIQRDRKAVLEMRVKSLKQDIQENNIFIETNIRAVRFDTVSVINTNPKSSIEIELEKAFDDLVHCFSSAFKQLINIKKKILKFEKKTAPLELIINSFNSTEQDILFLRYDRKMSYKSIGMKANMSESSVKRNVDRLLDIVAENLGIKEVSA